MADTKSLVEKLSKLVDEYDEIKKLCYDEELQSFHENPPEPKIAKWGFQKFSDEDCEKLADGKLTIKPYQTTPFCLVSPNKPNFPILSLVFVIAITIFAVTVLCAVIANDFSSVYVTIIASSLSVAFLFGLLSLGYRWKMPGIICYFRENKKYSREKAKYESQVKQHREDQINRKRQYDEDVQEELEHYKDRYSLYNHRRIEFYRQRDIKRKELPIKYAKVVERILSYEDVPYRYKKPLDVDFNEIEDEVEFYDDTVMPLREEVESLIEIIEDGRADTLKEAINCFRNDEYAREELKAEEKNRANMEWQAQRQAMEQERAQREIAIAPIQAQIATLKAQKMQLELRRNRANYSVYSALSDEIESIKSQIYALEREIAKIRCH